MSLKPIVIDNLQNQDSKFELTVLGCSGGPLDGRNCSYLLKNTTLTYNEIVDKDLKDQFICIDAGSGISALSDLINNIKNKKVMSENYLLELYTDSLSVDAYTNCQTLIPFNWSAKEKEKISPYGYSINILKLLKNIFITHSHFDHLSAAIINSPALHSKIVYGSNVTLSNIKKNIFNDAVWPNLITQDGTFLELKELLQGEWFPLNKTYRIKCFQNNHGSYLDNITGERKIYESSAYLINHLNSGRNLLLFGDVEPDSESKQNNYAGKNHIIWNEISQFIINGNLAGIMIECSNLPITNSNEPLYGHMSPLHLISEFLNLRDIVLEKLLQKKGNNNNICNNNNNSCLKGLNVIITHIKESEDGLDPRKRILKELQRLDEMNNLGLIFTIALPGLTYVL
ncbi:hypothetical protein PACTADRAFT_1971 [Pachysolen tannophilus NRRL Y-2460]|uniref:3',5'-cyclic-nucleotide phosphodiesterase n=1 Tax=Pachysolen tannophilus NRRL Y-2460 TaxID=669874 RepID=A0A1E4U092_PACTA|nr:hypothetical protein PACTADRAFT_1971 [Pachysolen tannophilus NRRL Y-2460]